MAAAYIPPRPAWNGTPAKGRWGWANDLVASKLNVDREKIWLQDLYPPPERNGTPAKGRWGWANDLVASKLNVDREKIWLQDLYPLRRRGTGLRRKDDGVGLTISSPVSSMSIEKKYGCRTYTPPPPERNG